MAKKKTKCANCGQTGGRFTLRGRVWVHIKCDPKFKGLRDDAKNPFNFSSMNIGQDPNQGPVQVTSLRQLRQLEKQHGVVSYVANYDQKGDDQRGG